MSLPFRYYIFLVFISFCLTVFSQEDTISINEVVISAGRTPVIYSESSRVVHVISKTEIESAPVQSIQGILEYSANVDVRQRGSTGVQADIGIRGGSFEQTLILLNDVPFNDPQTGHHNLDLPVDIENIERIEILEGPGSRIYGANAFSGAINIITKNETKKIIRLSLSGGENEYIHGTASASYPVGKLNNNISLHKGYCGGYIDNTDLDIYNLFYHTSWVPSFGKIDIQAGHCNKKFGANSFYTSLFPDQYEKTKTTFINLKFSGGKKIKFTPDIYWKQHQDYFVLKRDDPLFSMNNHLTDVFGCDINTSFGTKFGKTALGANYRMENILSNSLGDHLNDTLSVPGEQDGYFIKSKTRDNAGIFAEHSFVYKKLHFSAGLLINLFRGIPEDLDVYPGADISYKIFSNTKIFGSVNRSMRRPSFTELYYPGLVNIGNPNLKPEEAITCETGIKYLHDNAGGHIAVFRREGKNIIDWVKQNDTLQWESTNIPGIITNGFEISFTLFPKKIFNKNNPVKDMNISYSTLFLQQEKGLLENYISKYVLDYLKHKLTLRLRHCIYKKINASWVINAQDRAGSFTNTENNEEEYKPFSTIDLRIYRKADLFNIYFEISNLTDQKYYDIGNVEMPGRWMKAGIKINIALDHKK